LLLNLTAEAAWGEITAFQFYAAAKWANQNFIISNRKENDDRLTFEEKRVGLGFRTFCFGRMQFELEAGYVFDRILFAGQGMRNMRSGVALFDSVVLPINQDTFCSIFPIELLS
jgi:hypothetical protein